MQKNKVWCDQPLQSTGRTLPAMQEEGRNGECCIVGLWVTATQPQLMRDNLGAIFCSWTRGWPTLAAARLGDQGRKNGNPASWWCSLDPFQSIAQSAKMLGGLVYPMLWETGSQFWGLGPWRLGWRCLHPIMYGQPRRHSIQQQLDEASLRA